MDSLTQIALGAAIGEATLGRRVGRRAALWGAALGTLPDLDVFVPFGDPVADFTYHRSFSHSLIVLTLISPGIAWLIMRFHAGRSPPEQQAGFGGWWLLSFLVLVTHPLLDVFTVYGTQIWWPLDPTPYFVSSVFIVDPAYTLPLLLGLTGTWLLLRRRRAASTAPRRPWLPNALGLALSSTYLLWGLWAKNEIESFVHGELAAQDIAYEHMLTVPTPGNTVLWRILVMGDEAYYEGFRSLLDRGDTLRLQRIDHDPALLQGLEQHWPVQRLRWFTGGYYSVSSREGKIVITDLRMGQEPNYVFRFVVGRKANPHPEPLPPRQLPMAFELRELGWTWRRIFDEQAQL